MAASPGRAREPAAAWRSPPALIVVASASALTALYAAGTLALPLNEHFPSAGLSLDWIKMLGPGRRGPAVAYVAFVLAAFALYAVAVAVIARHGARLPRALVFGAPVLFAAALLFMYPPTAVDLFHYHADARTLWVFGENPLTIPPVRTDYPIGISWIEQPSPYGPAWSLLTVPLAPLMTFGDHQLATLIAFKALAAISYLASAWLIYRFVARTRPRWALLAFALFAWNPFVVLRVVGNGHNDLVMIAFALLALERAERRDWALAFPLIAISVLVKYTTALLVPPLLLYAWHRTAGSPTARVRALAPGLGLAAATTAICYAPFWAGMSTFDALRAESAKLITSTPDLLRAVLVETGTGDERATTLAREGARAAFLLIAIPVAWRARRSFDALLAGGFTLYLAYLLIAAAWFRPWYMLWPATLLMLRPGRWTIAVFLAITFGNAFPDLIEQYRYDWGLSGAIVPRLAPFAAQFGVPLAVWLIAVWRTRSLALGAAPPDARDAPSEPAALAPAGAGGERHARPSGR